MSRRIASVGVVAVVLLFVSACSGGGTGTSIRSGTNGSGAQPRAAAGAVGASGLRTVAYHGVQFDVPADWPVYDLAADPTRCVRLDVHAVYLGHPSADMACPAGLVGRADAVIVEPTEGGNFRNGAAATSAEVSSTTVNNLPALVANGGAVTYEVDASFPTAGVSVTLTYRDSDATVQQVLRSFRAVAK